MSQATVSLDELAALPGSLVLAGAGKMGGALLDGWLDRGLDPRRVTVVDPHASPENLRRFGARGVALNPTTIAVAGTLVLAIKPQSLAEAAPGLRGWTGPETLLLSIVAGKTVADLTAAFPAAGRIARAMPNTPAAVRQGITGIFCGDGLEETRRRELDLLLGAVERSNGSIRRT